MMQCCLALKTVLLSQAFGTQCVEEGQRNIELSRTGVTRGGNYDFQNLGAGAQSQNPMLKHRQSLLGYPKEDKRNEDPQTCFLQWEPGNLEGGSIFVIIVFPFSPCRSLSLAAGGRGNEENGLSTRQGHPQGYY